jgi:hypothetical protein
VLAPKPHGIAAAQAGVEQDVKPDPLPRPDRPSPLIGQDIAFRPSDKSLAFAFVRIFDSDCGVAFNVLRLRCPLEQPAHCLQEISGLSWRL